MFLLFLARPVTVCPFLEEGEKNQAAAPFLSAAQPTDQGEESVVLLLLVVVGGGPFFSLPCAVFWGVKRQKTLSKKGREKAKTLSIKGCDKAKTLSQRGCEKAKTSSKKLFSTPQISESIPFLFPFHPFPLFFRPPKSQVWRQIRVGGGSEGKGEKRRWCNSGSALRICSGVRGKRRGGVVGVPHSRKGSVGWVGVLSGGGVDGGERSEGHVGMSWGEGLREKKLPFSTVAFLLQAETSLCQAFCNCTI